MDITTLDQRSDTLKEKSMQRIKLFHDAWEEKIKQELEGKRAALPRDVSESQRSQWPSPWTYEFAVLLRRNMINVLRDKGSLGANIGQAIFLVVGPGLCCALHVLPMPMPIFGGKIMLTHSLSMPPSHAPTDHPRLHLLPLRPRPAWAAEPHWYLLLPLRQPDLWEHHAHDRRLPAAKGDCQA
jgi:hypothetical protein